MPHTVALCPLDTSVALEALPRTDLPTMEGFLEEVVGYTSLRLPEFKAESVVLWCAHWTLEAGEHP